MKNEIGSTKPLKIKMDSPVNDPLIIESWWTEGLRLLTSSSQLHFFFPATYHQKLLNLLSGVEFGGNYLYLVLNSLINSLLDFMMKLWLKQT